MKETTTTWLQWRNVEIVAAWFDGWFGWYYNVKLDTLFIMVPLVGFRWKHPPFWLPMCLWLATVGGYGILLALLLTGFLWSSGPA